MEGEGLELEEDEEGTPRRRGLHPLQIGAIAIGGVLLLLGAFVAFGAFYVWSAKEQPVDDHDRASVLTIEDVAEWDGEYEPHENAATLVKRRYMDGAWELEYEYATVDEYDPYTLYASVDLERKISDARGTYVTYTAMNRFVGTIEGDSALGIEDCDELFSFGDRSRCAYLTYEGEPYGHLLVALKGKHVLYVTLSGGWTDSPEDLAGLLQPACEVMSAWSPKDER